MKWYPVELHTHTEHSDGDFTVAGLVHAAKDRGFTAVALTDHNTASGLAEFAPALAREGLTGVAGIEWTTYFGHMLVLGEQGYTDWRGVRPGQIDEAIAAIHQNHGVVGIAHPFALSNPVNTCLLYTSLRTRPKQLPSRSSNRWQAAKINTKFPSSKQKNHPSPRERMVFLWPVAQNRDCLLYTSVGQPGFYGLLRRLHVVYDLLTKQPPRQEFIHAGAVF